MDKDHAPGRLWRLIERHIAETGPYPPSERAVARHMNIKPTTLNNWKHQRMTRLPEVEHFRAVSRVTGVRYEEVLQAALIDAGYLYDSDVATDATRAESRRSGGRGAAGTSHDDTVPGS